MNPEKLKEHLARLASGFASLVGYHPTPAPAVQPANVIAARYAAAQDTPLGAPVYAAGPLAVSVPQAPVTNIVTAQRPTILESQLDELQAKMLARATSPNVLQRRVGK